MAGIRSFGAYIPKFRLTKDTKGWGFPGEKAVANFDEDSLTMGVAAGLDCLKGVDRSTIDGLIFATTTAPYGEKQSAATIATALDLRGDISTTDLTDVLRAGASALRVALDSVSSGSARNILVIASDMRQAPPKSDSDRSIGDAAAAILISNDELLAESEGAHSVSEHMMDSWRPTGDPFVHTGEDRFIADEGYHRVMKLAVEAALKKQGLTPKDITRAAYGSGNARAHADMARRWGLEPSQVQDPLYGKAGATGSAMPLLLLAGALEELGAGQRILVAAYGDGADVLFFKTTPAIAARQPARRGVKSHLDSKDTIPDHDAFLQWRQLLGKEAARRPNPQPISIQAAWRDRDAILRLYGGKCECGHIAWPPQRVCPFCREQDKTTSVRLAETPGEIYTYSMDYVGGNPDVPTVIGVINFQGGGRMLTQITDRVVSHVRIGLPLEMTFRKIGTIEGIHNYFWKGMPIRNDEKSVAEAAK